MIWDRLTGHDRQVEMFRRALQRGRLTHALLLLGPAGIGKQTFAQFAAQCLFCETLPNEAFDACGACHSCRQMTAGTHPDLLSIARPEGKREIPIELLVGDSDHRGRAGLCHDISLSPMQADRRIAIVDDADQMNDYSANSLLKTLEEPPEGCLLFLIASNPEAVLPTIRSRCQSVLFAPLTNDVLTSLLRGRGVSDEDIASVVPFAEGSLETAEKLLQPELQQLRLAVEQALDGIGKNSARSRELVGAALEELGGDPAAQRRYAGWAVAVAAESLRQRLQSISSLEQSDRLGDMLERCSETEWQLKQSMPIALCLDALFSGMGRRARGVAD